MGLDTSYDCFHGPYSTFHRWRVELAKVAGLPPLELMEGFYENKIDAMRNPFWRYQEENPIINEICKQLPIRWDVLKKDCLHELLYHSDCEGYLRVGLLKPLAERLEQLLPNVDENWKERTQQFIDGLKAARKENRRVEFG